MNLADLYNFLLAMTLAFALFALGCLIEIADRRIGQWRLRRKLRNLPAPDDPRQRNVVSLRDWKNRETAAKRLRRVA